MLKELKEKFLWEFTPSERLFFLKKAKEAVAQKGYPADEDLFQYCYFLTLKERMSGIDGHGGEGFMRFLLVESKQDIEKEVKYFEKRLEKKKRTVADVVGYRLIEHALGGGNP